MDALGFLACGALLADARRPLFCAVRVFFFFFFFFFLVGRVRAEQSRAVQCKRAARVEFLAPYGWVGGSVSRWWR